MIVAPLELKLDGVVAYWAQSRADQIVLEYDPVYQMPALTWGEFEQYIQGMAQVLSASIEPGDKVGLVCDDSIDFHILIDALWRCGAAVLLINRSWGTAVVEDLIQITECQLVFCKDETISVGKGSIPQLPYPELHKPQSPWLIDAGAIDDVAIMAATSGSDKPRCVAITHRMLRLAYRSCMSVHNFDEIRQTASLFPLNGIGVLSVCFLLLREVGASTFVLPPFSMLTIQTSWEAVLTRNVNFVYLIPPVVRLLNILPPSHLGKPPILAFCGSAPIQRHELQQLETKFPVAIHNIYGLTEMSFAVFFGCRDVDGTATDSIGYPVGFETKLVDEEGNLIEGAGRGELYLKGPMLTKGYIGNLTDTNLTWHNDWLKTGDIAERNLARQYFIRGRVKDVIIRGGILYYLYELEHYLGKAPHVIDACAFKGRNLPSGDEICVVVQVDRPTLSKVLLEWIQEQIGKDKVPNKLFIWEQELPKNSNGNGLRSSLEEMYLAGSLRSM